MERPAHGPIDTGTTALTVLRFAALLCAALLLGLTLTVLQSPRPPIPDRRAMVGAPG